MSRMPQARLLPDGRRLHLQDGPIDLVIGAFGGPHAVEDAYRAALRALTGLLDRLCGELPALRQPAGPTAPPLHGTVARRMAAAVALYGADTFITPMAAVAGAVAETVLAAMVEAADLDRAYVNNGGDIALHCASGPAFTLGLIDRPDRPHLFGRVEIGPADAVRGVATSGWRGRSFSLGIADSVTVLARTAAAADAAATVIANAVDLPGHPAVRRVPAHDLQPDSDLGGRLVTRNVAPLPPDAIATALRAGRACAETLLGHGLIEGVALQLQGRVATLGTATLGGPAPHPLAVPAAPVPEFAHHA
ncbi:UPF0280 family protein [Lichenihabitans sp. Uapishka_5]|uniref:UPF0280 family protein n=1 Tax=Lichenihabitans sp. Uapishka_5 TaxID=3037302 RepID=UPI0029E8178D|nr:UPF0280 family protein [Lichenihabitans sp. Uapishka_5]MDX7949945.1 UPF0280 family protein [Lichenihabitans sp. Uapishka_5]